MPGLQRLILLRHGETTGESSIRYHGRNDVELSEAGRAQMQAAAREIEIAGVDRVVASSLARARESAEIVAPNFEVSLEDDLREVNFGRWEGLTAGEIENMDPELYAGWRESTAGFDYPDGERRADFLERIQRGFERCLPAAGEAETVLVVAHKGVIRVAVAHLLPGFTFDDGHPALGSALVLERRGAGPWRRVVDARAVHTP